MGTIGGEIKPLAEDSVRRIVAEQAVTDLCSIVKELVDNALDAESTTIKIRLFGQGLDIIEVSDDGCGVPKESRPNMAARYTTSKIGSFEDIYTGTGLTMGFRGEALFSMACLSEKLIVATRTEEDEMAEKLEFGRDGTLLGNAAENIHRKIGTTVAVVKPFSLLPARRVDMMRRIRSERAKLFRLMESYAIFNVGVQLNLIDISNSGREDVALATSMSSAKLEETISSVLGHKFLATLETMELRLEELLQRSEDSYNWGIKGLISKNPKGDVPDRTVNLYSINGRVVELPKVTAVLRKVWVGFGGRKKPSCVLDFTLPNDAFDINLSPDKQQVLLTHEQEICQLLETHVTSFWSSKTMGVFEVNQLEVPLEEDEAEGEHEEGGRHLHKRRFAFVHDLSKAKLQHHLEGRQKGGVDDCDDEQKLVEADQQLKETGEKTQYSSSDQEPPYKKAKVVSREELTNPESTAPHASTEQPNVRENTNVSDMERWHWAEAQKRFNSGENTNTVLSQPTPVSPEDLPAAGASSTNNSNATIERCKRQDKRGNAPVDISKRKTQQQSLEQFAFKAVEPGMTRRRSKRARPEPDSPEACQEGERQCKASPAPRGSRSKSGGVNPSDQDEGDATGEQEAIETGSTGLNEVPPAEGFVRVVSAPNEDLSNQQNGINGAAPSLPRGEVVWRSFRGTEDVCRSARLERLEARRRKNELDQVRARVGRTNSIAREAEDVTNSVGEQESPKRSSINLSKSTFREMKVIGQFNLGFMLATCSSNHLWILDQHACDEKYNFEQLCRETVIHQQRLLKPMKLDLSPMEEACILDNMTTFEANGFHFDFQPDAPVRQRLSLTTLPHSGAQDGRKAVQFGKDDVRALCAILSDGASYDAGDGGTGTDGSGLYGNNAVRRHASTANSQADDADRIIARLPKAIAMFASRACRTSIMIGTALSPKEMTKIVERLAAVEFPWNCPHGRPTMRHVGDILPILLNDERKAAEYSTGPTVAITPMTQDPSNDE